MKIKSYLLIVSLFAVCALSAMFCSCSDKDELLGKEEDWCLTVAPTYYKSVENLPCNVFSVDNSSFILPLDTISGIPQDSTLIVLRQIGKDEFSIIGSSEVINLDPYIGKTISISGSVKLEDQKTDSLKIDGVIQKSTIYRVEKLKILP